jgi:hypothetical protein
MTAGFCATAVGGFLAAFRDWALAWLAALARRSSASAVAVNAVGYTARTFSRMAIASLYLVHVRVFVRRQFAFRQVDRCSRGAQIDDEGPWTAKPGLLLRQGCKQIVDS